MKGKRIVMLAENQYQEVELWVPYYRMKEEGAKVKVVEPACCREIVGALAKTA